MAAQVVVDAAQISALCSAFTQASARVNEILGSLDGPASGVGGGLGDGRAEASYAEQWRGYRQALQAAAECLDNYARAVRAAAGSLVTADASMAGR